MDWVRRNLSGGFQVMADAVEEAKYIQIVIQRMNNLINHVWESEAKKIGLTRPQISALQALYHLPGLSLKDLSNHLGLAHSTVSGIIDRLENKGLVERRLDTGDKRFSRLYVSPRVNDYVSNEMPISLETPLVPKLLELTHADRQKVQESLAILERTFLGQANNEGS